MSSVIGEMVLICYTNHRLKMTVPGHPDLSILNK